MKIFVAFSVLAALLGCERTEVRAPEPKTAPAAEIAHDSARTRDSATANPGVAPSALSQQASAVRAASSTSEGLRAPPDTAPSVHFSSPQDSICGEFAERGLKFVDSRRSAMAAQYGKPDSVHAKPLPNPYTTAQIDTIVDVFYPHLQLQYWVIGKQQLETDSMLEADISDNKYLKYPHFGIGATQSEITAGLGEPGERTDDTFSYECALHIMSGADVTFHFASGRVTRIVYRWEMD